MIVLQIFVNGIKTHKLVLSIIVIQLAELFVHQYQIATTTQDQGSVLILNHVQMWNTHQKQTVILLKKGCHYYFGDSCSDLSCSQITTANCTIYNQCVVNDY